MRWTVGVVCGAGQGFHPIRSGPPEPAADTFWGGYSGYFADPDGHPWELAYNPYWGLDEAGRVVVPG